MTYKSEEQVRADHLRAMGQELGTIHHALYRELCWLHIRWRLYRQLYAHSRERVDILNRAAEHFFGALQVTLFDDVLLHLAKLTDPPQSVGRERRDNLTVCRLAKMVPDTLRAQVKAAITAAEKACQPARMWRNRRVAHLDLEVALATAGDPLPGISRKDVEGALTELRAVLNILERHYCHSEGVHYQGIEPPPGDADALVHYLQRGLQTEGM